MYNFMYRILGYLKIIQILNFHVIKSNFCTRRPLTVYINVMNTHAFTFRISNFCLCYDIWK